MGIEELIKALSLEGEAADKLRTFFTEREKTAKAKLDKATDKLTALEAEKKAAEAAGEKFTALAKKLGIDTEAEDLDAAVDAALEEVKKAAGNPTPQEIAKLKKELGSAKKEAERLLAEKTQAEGKYGELRGKYQGGLIRQALHKALTEAGVSDPDFLSEALMAKVKVSEEDDTLTYIGKDGAEMEIGDGVAEFTKAHPNFVVNAQRPGAGTLPGAQGGSKGGVNPLVQKLIENNQAAGESGKALDTFFN